MERPGRSLSSGGSKSALSPSVGFILSARVLDLDYSSSACAYGQGLKLVQGDHIQRLLAARDSSKAQAFKELCATSAGQQNVTAHQQIRNGGLSNMLT